MWWQVLEYMKYCAYRFKRRTERWKGMENSENASVQENLQTLDAQCFSAQYYYMICLGGLGTTLMLMSLEMLIRINHNPFGDKMSFFVILLTLLIIWVSIELMLMFDYAWRYLLPTHIFRCILTQFLRWICWRIARRFLWHIPPMEAEYAQPQMPPKEVTLPDLYGKDTGGMDPDMTSDSFKHRFLEANKNWLIEQLKDHLRGDDDGDDSQGPEGDLLKRGKKKRPDHEISSDEGTDSDGENAVNYLDEAAKVFCRILQSFDDSPGFMMWR